MSLLKARRDEILEVFATTTYDPDNIVKFNRFVGSIDVIDDFLNDNIHDYLMELDEDE